MVDNWTSFDLKFENLFSYEPLLPTILFVLRYFPNALLARVPQLSYDNLDYDGEPGIEFGPRRTVE